MDDLHAAVGTVAIASKHEVENAYDPFQPGCR